MLPDPLLGDNLIVATRTCRRFNQQTSVANSTLLELINLARLSGSARNGQPWQYMAVSDPQICEIIFPHLGWAGYLRDWPGPAEGERPPAYILCYLNSERLIVSEKEAAFDLGIASQSLLLGAAARNILGCRIGAFSKSLQGVFETPDHLSLDLVIALGEPTEQIILDEMNSNGVAYWHNEKGVHHVPKRKLEDVVVNLPLRPL